MTPQVMADALRVYTIKEITDKLPAMLDVSGLKGDELKARMQHNALFVTALRVGKIWPDR